jgi:hypothetical protein
LVQELVPEQLNDIKKNLKNLLWNDISRELWIEFISSIENIKNFLVWKIDDKSNIIKEKLVTAKKEYELNMWILTNIYRKKIEESDKRKKETLDYLQKTWFDQIPQDITNKLITEIKSNIFIVHWLNLNVNTIDIANGNFWEDVLDKWWTVWQDNIIKFMEKLIYGKVWSKDSIFYWKQFKWEFWATINPTDINYAIEKNGLKNMMWWNINTIRNNLKKK